MLGLLSDGVCVILERGFGMGMNCNNREGFFTSNRHSSGIEVCLLKFDREPVFLFILFFFSYLSRQQVLVSRHEGSQVAEDLT